jgi:hypothetical protein
MKRTGPASCDQCQARIVFVFMTATGKPVPVDPMPVDDGNVCARQVSPTRKEGYVISKDKPPNPSYTRFAAHFGTCDSRPRPAPKPKTEPAPTLFDIPTQQGRTTA